MNTESIESGCLFCRIVAGELPSQRVAETQHVIAFNDIDPQAPVHTLVVPKEHYGDVAQVAAANPELLAEMITVADQVAGTLADGQFRLIFNSGPRAGQSVFHVHAHVIAGAQLGWTPA